VKIGISTGLFNEHDLVNLLPIFKRTGFEVIEVGTGTPEWNPFPPSQTYDHQHMQGLIDKLQTFRMKIHSLHLREKLKENGIEVNSLHTSFGNGFDISSFDDNVRATGVNEVKKNIEVLAFLNGKIAVVHPGGHLFNSNDHDERKKRVERARLSLNEITKYAEEKGVKVAVENLLPHLVCGYSHEVLDLVNGFNTATVGICFDSSHANLAENPAEVLRKLSPRLITLHMSDNFGKFDDHLIPGKGKINFPELARILKEVSYQGVFTMEVLGDLKGQDPYKVLRAMYSSAEEILKAA
jgi:sugar phosphate isomerase/epimerase